MSGVQGRGRCEPLRLLPDDEGDDDEGLGELEDGLCAGAGLTAGWEDSRVRPEFGVARVVPLDGGDDFGASAEGVEPVLASRDPLPDTDLRSR